MKIHILQSRFLNYVPFFSNAILSGSRNRKLQSPRVLHFPLLFFFLTGFIVSSCSSVNVLPAMKDGHDAHVWSGKSDAGVWTVSMEKKKKENSHFRITGSALAPSFLTGEAFLQSDGSWILHADNLEWFNNWKNGWTRATITVWGSYLLEQTEGNDWHMVLLEPVVTDSVQSGAIRYGDKVMYGDLARDLIQRRWSRIMALSDHLKKSFNHKFYPEFTSKKRKDRKSSFEYQVGQFLFPEKYGYPESSLTASDDIHEMNEGIMWNLTYTDNNFPEELIPVRNSGTMYRDWEESPRMLYAAVNWIYMTEQSLTNTLFTKGK